MLLLISGSLRKGSFNTQLLNAVAASYGGPSEHADLNLPLYNGDDEDAHGIPAAVQTVADQIAAAEAVVIASPEYNQSFSGVLKNGLDWVSRVDGNPWKDKPVALVHAAAGRTGGARANFALRLAMVQFQPRLVQGPELLVAGAHNEIAADGTIENAQYQKAISGIVEKLKAEVARDA